MNRKITNWFLLVFCLTMVSLAQAQQTGKIFRVGYVSTAAKQIGLEIPQSVLYRADRVIK